MDESPKTSQSWAIPIAIIVGFGLIAAAIYFNGSGGRAPIAASDSNQASEQPAQSLTPVRTISEDDHVRGDPNAPVVIVEFSDYDCPFCKRFHDTMRSVMSGRYGQDGDVAWVYRHLPIQNLHPNAPAISHASECVADIGGNEKFWEFSDLYYDSQGQVSDLTTIVTQLEEIDINAFTTCMDETRHLEAIRADMDEAAKAGGAGTPFNVFVFAEPMPDSLKTLVGTINDQIKMQTGRPEDSFKIISDNQLSMSGAFGEEYINQILATYLGVSL